MSRDQENKICQLFAEKIQEEGTQEVLLKYRNMTDLTDIAQKFINKLPGFVEMLASKYINSRSKVYGSEDVK